LFANVVTALELVWQLLAAKQLSTNAVPKAANVYQLKKRADFLSIAASGNRRSLPCFVLQTAPNNLDQVRIGYTVTKRTSKLAVVRNRIKRRLRAAVHEMADNFVSGNDYVFIGKLDAETREFELLKNDIKYALKKLGQ
jgi:ribonuclease P protein component